MSLRKGLNETREVFARLDGADGLLRLSLDDDWHSELRAAGLARAAEFSWQRAAEETVRVYDAVM